MLVLPVAGAGPAAEHPQDLINRRQLGEKVNVRVWDSTAEVRYLVLPMQPEGSDGLDEGQLAELVTRDSMIGTGLPLSPEVLR